MSILCICLSSVSPLSLSHATCIQYVGALLEDQSLYPLREHKSYEWRCCTNRTTSKLCLEHHFHALHKLTASLYYDTFERPSHCHLHQFMRYLHRIGSLSFAVCLCAAKGTGCGYGISSIAAKQLAVCHHQASYLGRWSE